MREIKNAKMVIKDGVVDVKESAMLAKKNVKQVGGVPVHACGLISHRDCPCWVCTSENCQTCMASMY